MPEDKKTKGKKEIRALLVHPWKVFGFEAFLFALNMALGILAGLRLKEIFEIQKIFPQPISVIELILYFVLATAFLLLVIYFFKRRKAKGVFFKIIFALTLGLGNFYFFGLWLPGIIVIPLIIVLIIFLFKKTSLLLHNAALLFAAAGIGAGLGMQLTPLAVVLLLAIFSVYDFIAVYKTKHMVKMAEVMLEHRAILGIVVPQKISDFRAQLKEVEPGGRFLVLGAGDIVFPLILVVSVLPFSVVDSLVVAIFSLIGLLAGFLIFISKKERTPMPALPPIALFSVIGYLLTILV